MAGLSWGSLLLVLCGIILSSSQMGLGLVPQCSSMWPLHPARPPVLWVKEGRHGSCSAFLMPGLQSLTTSLPCILFIKAITDQWDISFVSDGSSSRCVQGGAGLLRVVLEEKLHSPSSGHNSHSSLLLHTTHPFSQEHKSHPLVAST